VHPWRRLRQAAPPSPLVIDGSVVAALLVLFAIQLQTALIPGQRPATWLTWLLALAMTLPFVAHRQHPVLVAAVVLSALVCYALRHYGPYPGINAFVLVFGVSLHAERRQSLPVLVAALGALTVSVWTQPTGVATTSTWVSTFLLTLVAALVGENLRHRRARWAALEERAGFLEVEREERARRAVTEERLRIARELHDVVAHSMSVIAVQSGVGHHVLDTQPEEARRALAAIETTSRSALTEMRQLLGVLRQDGQSRAELAPSPGLADLPFLLEQVRKAGLDVSLTETGDATELPAPVDLTTYRIVQEALTNILKHGGPRAEVRITHSPSELYVEVLDEGRPVSVTPGAPTAETGHGLIGMRERVAVFGGRIVAGARPGGGFRVAVHLPLSAVRP
jgi:signal transduction histidine kinase